MSAPAGRLKNNQSARGACRFALSGLKCYGVGFEFPRRGGGFAVRALQARRLPSRRPPPEVIAQPSPRQVSGKRGPNGHYFYRIRPCRVPSSPGGADCAPATSARAWKAKDRIPHIPFFCSQPSAPAGRLKGVQSPLAGLRTRQKKKRICTCVAMFPGLAAGARAQSARRALTRSDGPVVLRPVPPAASSAASALDASVYRLRLAVSHPHYLRPSAESADDPSLPLCSIPNPQSTIRNRPAPRPQSTGPQPKFHTVYGTRTGFDPLLMVCHDAWHLIIFRAFGGQN